MAAKPGQQISFSLIDLSMFDPLITDQGNEDLGYILDSKSEKVFPIEPAGREESLIADTITNEVTIALSSHENRKFLIKFKGREHQFSHGNPSECQVAIHVQIIRSLCP